MREIFARGHDSAADIGNIADGIGCKITCRKLASFAWIHKFREGVTSSNRVDGNFDNYDTIKEFRARMYNRKGVESWVEGWGILEFLERKK